MSHKTVDTIDRENRNKILSRARHHLERIDPTSIPEKYDLLLLLASAERAEANKHYAETDLIIRQIDERTQIILDRLGIKLAKT